MKRVYSSASLWEAREILALLQQHRIPAMLLNENVAGTPGILPFNPAMTVDAEVWVVDTDLADRCARLITEFQSAESSPGEPGQPPWRCAGCREENPPDFDLCWSCSRPK